MPSEIIDVVYMDGPEVRRIKGTITERTDNYLVVETDTRFIKIYNSQLIKEEWCKQGDEQ